MSRKPGARKSSVAKRKPRADAVRNRERVLEAAKNIFRDGGPTASLEAVAKYAGVGIGTLYRHFPTREALFEAVYQSEIDHLSEMAMHPERGITPLEALRRWLRSCVAFFATKRGMVSALALVAYRPSPYSQDRFVKNIGMMMARAVEAGEIRSDVNAHEFHAALVGMFCLPEQPGWQQTAQRLLDIFVDGLCVQTDTKAKTPRRVAPRNNLRKAPREISRNTPGNPAGKKTVRKKRK